MFLGTGDAVRPKLIGLPFLWRSRSLERRKTVIKTTYKRTEVTSDTIHKRVM